MTKTDKANKKEIEEKIFLPYWAETTTKLIVKWDKEYWGKIGFKEYLTEICKEILGADKVEKIIKGGEKK